MKLIDLMKQLREETGRGLSEIKTAIVESDGTYEGALEYLNKNSKQSDKPVGAGLIFSYVHHNGKIGTLLDLRCGTDFTCGNVMFQEFGQDLAMQVAAGNATDVDQLLEQPLIKNPSITVKEALAQVSTKFGEPVVIARFHKYVVGLS